MRRASWCFALLLLPVFVSQAAYAIQLKWSSGASNLNFTSARRCTLMVHTGPQESPLPGEWELQWITKNSTRPAIAVRTESAVGQDTARVCTLDWPGDTERHLANEVTAHFCSGASATAAWARYVVDVPSGTQGKFQMVAFHPTSSDSSSFTILRSPEVTVNGGLTRNYAPIIFHVTVSHVVDKLKINVAGVRLATVDHVSLVAADASWLTPIQITDQSDSTLSAAGAIAADIPQCFLELKADSGAIASTAIPADHESVLPLNIPASATGIMRDPASLYYPKDFAFVYAHDKFHLFYIRSTLINQPLEWNLGHQTSTDMVTWGFDSLPRDTTLLQVNRSSNAWDNLHVWAPSIVLKGLTYHMFYTGVQRTTSGLEIQRIGDAQSTDLVHWPHASTWLFSADQSNWAAHDSTTSPGRQCRDPFVMPDPNRKGAWFMYYAAQRPDANHYGAIGAAWSDSGATSLASWRDSLEFTNTRITRINKQVESPHAFVHHDVLSNQDRWWLMDTESLDNGYVFFQTNTVGPADPTSTDWKPVGGRDTLWAYVKDPMMKYWHSTEWLKAGQPEFLAAWSDSTNATAWPYGIVVRRIKWKNGAAGTPDTITFADTISVASVGKLFGRERPVALRLVRLSPGSSDVRLSVELPRAMHVKVAVFDVLGRRVRTLTDRDCQAGATAVNWDARDGDGHAVSSGLYFARLASPAGVSLVKLPFVR